MHILYLHTGSFAKFNAGALRTANMIRAMTLSGHTVELVTADRDDVMLSTARRTFDLPGSVALSAGGLDRGRALRGLFPRRPSPLARPLTTNRRPDLVFLFGVNHQSFREAGRYASSRRAPLLIDMDEWMGPRDFSVRSWLTGFPLRYEMLMRRLPSMSPYSVCISRQFADYLGSKGGKALVVPPLHRSRTLESRPRPQAEASPGDRRRVHILVPGVRRIGHGKDRLNLLALAGALTQDPTLGASLALDVVGGVEDAKGQDALSVLQGLTQVHDHGFVPWERSKELLASADWMMTLRDPAARRLLYAFPSKVTESLIAGTPVIVNDYSDMRTAIDTRTSGLLLERPSVEDLIDALRVAVSLPFRNEQVAAEAARRFSPEAVSAELDSFLQDVVKDHALRNTMAEG